MPKNEKQCLYTSNVRAVRTDSQKYIQYPLRDGSSDRHMAELYDLKKASPEERNLVADASKASLIKKLKDDLQRLMLKSGIRVLAPSPQKSVTRVA